MRVLAVLLLAVPLAPAGSARAATVEMDVVDAAVVECTGSTSTGCSTGSDPVFRQARLRVEGQRGERNDVRSRVVDGAVVVSDAAAPLVAGRGCVQAGANEVRCDGPVPVGASVALGDGDDRARVVLPRRVLADPTEGGRRVRVATVLRVHLGRGDDRLDATAGRVLADGEEGDDRLATGAGRDELIGGVGDDVLSSGPGQDLLLPSDKGSDPFGGVEQLPGDRTPRVAPAAARSAGVGPDRIRRFSPGRDVLDGGAGRSDSLSYSGHPVAVRADLRRGRANEDVVRGVEGVQGTVYADTLIGSDRAEILLGDDTRQPRGGRVRDVLVGRGGDDVLLGGEVVAAGRGNDRVGSFAGDGVEFPSRFPAGARIRCGDGVDRVIAPRPSSSLSACETVEAGFRRRYSVRLPSLGLRRGSSALLLIAGPDGNRRALSVELRAAGGVVFRRVVRPAPGATAVLRLPAALIRAMRDPSGSVARIRIEPLDRGPGRLSFGLTLLG